MKQAGSNKPYFKMMKPNEPETFRFDWQNPVLNEEDSQEEWESWFEEQREKNLGIESYSSVYSFIYITNYQVRHEILIPLATLATFFEVERAEPAFLEIAEQDAVAQRIKALFSIGNPVVIDNVEVKPVFDRIDFYGVSLRDFAMRAERQRVSMANGRVGIIMSYSTKGMPATVEVTWDKFNDSLKSVDAVVIAFDEVQKTEFTMFLEDNTFRWNNKDRQAPAPITNVQIDPHILADQTIDVPVVSAGLAALVVGFALLALRSKTRWLLWFGLAAAAVVPALMTQRYIIVTVDNPFAKTITVSNQQASDIFSQLHKNLFRAFDYHNESDIYDALAKSVDGKLLRRLYLQINESLKVQEQGGAISHIDEVKIISGQKLDRSPERQTEQIGFGFRSKWDLIGTVEHWGHVHQRTNKYDAEFQIHLVDGNWKITDLQVLDDVQGPVKTSMRRF
jgi:hypothetical protein